MTSLSETDAAVQDDASVADVVTIPWHYLGAIQCLARGDRKQTLHSVLLDPALGNDKVRDALKADQGNPKSMADGLLGRVLEIAGAPGYGKPGYTWDPDAWPDNFPIRIRTADPGVFPHPDIFLSKDGFVLPWPWDGPTGPLKARRQTAFVGHADTLGGTLTTSSGLRLTAFMRAGDDAVTNMDLWVDFRDWVAEGNSAKQWIVNRAMSEYKYTGPAYPASVLVIPDSSRLPTATAWEIKMSGMTTGEMTLKLGTMGLPTSDIKIDVDIIYDHWPCGAFV